MGIRKAKFAAWVIMALLAGLLAFIFAGSRAAFGVMEGIFAVYGFISCGDDLIRWLAAPEGRGSHGRKARAQQ